ncbi:hypothetical protein VTK56DRAFT_1964 [Thermocarpiscus australiensis]
MFLRRTPVHRTSLRPKPCLNIPFQTCSARRRSKNARVCTILQSAALITFYSPRVRYHPQPIFRKPPQGQGSVAVQPPLTSSDVRNGMDRGGSKASVSLSATVARLIATHAGGGGESNGSVPDADDILHLVIHKRHGAQRRSLTSYEGAELTGRDFSWSSKEHWHRRPRGVMLA